MYHCKFQYNSILYVSYLNISDGTRLLDLVWFWTAGSTIPCGTKPFLVKFDGGANSLPLSETCFMTIILPAKHADYQSFKNMDIALKFGSHGFCFY